MNELNKKFSTQDIVQAFYSDACIQILDGSGYQQNFQSQDIRFEDMQRIALEHDFVSRINKASGLPFEFSRDMNGATLKRESTLADQFYNVLNVPTGSLPPKYYASENVKVFRETATKIGLYKARFTGNALSVIGADGLLEGELINAFVLRLLEATKRKAFKAASGAAASQTTQGTSKFKRYLYRHLAIKPDLNALRVELQYLPKISSEISLQESAKHILAFVTALDNDVMTSVVGYWWKREYSTEMGFFYHLVLLYDSSATFSEYALQQELHDFWQAVTAGRGSLFNQAYNPQNYRSWGVGQLQNSWEKHTDMLVSGVQLMLAKDQLLRLRSDVSVEHVGMSKLPKPINKEVKESPWIVGMQRPSIINWLPGSI